MAWPRKSRSSTSRREASRAVVGVVSGVVAILVGVVLLLGSRAEPQAAAGLRGATVDSFAPVWSALRAPAEVVAAGIDWVDDYLNAVDRNRRLEAELRQLNALRERQAALIDENLRLRSLLKVADSQTRLVAVARIAGGSAASLHRTAVISAGRRQGVAVGQPVRSAAGLIGRVTEVGSGAARVMLLTDPNSHVPVRVERTGQAGMAVGVDGRTVELRFLEPGRDRPRVGDRLVTSGDGGIFPPGVPVAIITREGGDTISAKPVASLSALGFVIVEAAFMPDLSEQLAGRAPPPSPQVYSEAVLP